MVNKPVNLNDIKTESFTQGYQLFQLHRKLLDVVNYLDGNELTSLPSDEFDVIGSSKKNAPTTGILQQINDRLTKNNSLIDFISTTIERLENLSGKYVAVDNLDNVYGKNCTDTSNNERATTQPVAKQTAKEATTNLKSRSR